MTALFALLACFFFALAVVGWSMAYVEKHQRNVDTESLKKVGGWYEGRVEELENENRQLAEQVVASGAVVRQAMPIPPADYPYEYHTDPTGLVVDRVDPAEGL